MNVDTSRMPNVSFVHYILPPLTAVSYDGEVSFQWLWKSRCFRINAGSVSCSGKCFIRFLSAELTESAYRELHGTHIERELVSQLMIGTQRHSCNRVLSNDKFLIWITQVEAIGMSYWVFTTLLYLQTTSRWPPGVGHQCIVCNPIWNVQSVFVRIMDSILFAALRLQILLQVRCIFFRRSN